MSIHTHTYKQTGNHLSETVRYILLLNASKILQLYYVPSLSFIQRLLVVLTLVSGLDFIHFELNVVNRHTCTCSSIELFINKLLMCMYVYCSTVSKCFQVSKHL